MKKLFIALLLVLGSTFAQAQSQDDTCHPCVLGKTLIAHGREEIIRGKSLIKKCKDYRYDDAPKKERRSFWEWLTGHSKKKKSKKAVSIPGIYLIPEPEQTISDGDTTTHWVTHVTPADPDGDDTSHITESSLVKEWPTGKDSVYTVDSIKYITSFRSNRIGDSITTSVVTKEYDPVTETWERIDRNVSVNHTSTTSTVVVSKDTCDALTKNYFFMLDNTKKQEGDFVTYSREKFDNLPEDATIPKKAIASMFRVSRDITQIRFIYHRRNGVKTVEIVTTGCVDTNAFKDNLLMHSMLEGYWDLAEDEVQHKKN